MRFLLTLATIHRFGCLRIAQSHKAALESLGHSVDIVYLPGDRTKEVFLPVPLSKKSYDCIMAFEYAPPRSWTESGYVIWVPMGELVYRHHFDDIWSWLHIVWHNRDGYDLVKQQHPWTDSVFLQFGIANIEDYQADRITQPFQGPIKVLLQERIRSYDCSYVVNLLREYQSNRLIIRVTDEHHKLPRDTNILADEIISGTLSHAEMLDLISTSHVVLSPRTQEGAGLLLHESALVKRAIIGPDAATFNHTFPSQAGNFLQVEPNQIETSSRQTFMPVVKYTDKSFHSVARRLNSISHDELQQIGKDCHQDMQRAQQQFIDDYQSIALGNLSPRAAFSHGWNYRKMGLIVNFWKGGGQGLFEAYSTRALESLTHWSWLSAGTFCSWVTKEPAYIGKVAVNGRTRIVAPCLETLMQIRSDLIIVHWSGALQAEAKQDDFLQRQLDDLEMFISKKTAPLIVWVHEVKPEAWPSHWDPDLVVFPSQHALDKFTREVKINQAVVIPHFIDPELKPSRNPLAQLTFLCLGRLVKSKVDLSYYLSLAPIFREGKARLLIVGEIDPEIRRGLTDLNIPYEHQTAYDPAEKSEILSDSHVLIHFSPSYESFCLSALEAMTFNCPVVTNRTELSELTQGGGIIVQSPSEAYAVCEKLVSDPELLIDFSFKAAQRASSFCKEEWLNQFNKAVNLITRTRRSVCVCVIATNEQGYLLRAVQSIQQCDEILIIANYPDELTSEVIQDIQQTYEGLKVIWLEKRYTQGQVFNQVTQHTVCDVIVFLDGDDELFPEATAVLSASFQKMESNVTLAYGDCETYNIELQQTVEMNYSQDSQGNALELMLKGHNVVGHPIAVARWALQMIRIDESLQASADKDLVLKLEEMGDLAYVPRKLYKYYLGRPGSITAEKRQIQLACRERVLKSAQERRSKVKDGK